MSAECVLLVPSPKEELWEGKKGGPDAAMGTGAFMGLGLQVESRTQGTLSV